MRTEKTSCGSKLALRWSGSRHSASPVRLVRKNGTKWLKWPSKTLPASPAGSNLCSENNGDCQHLCLATPGSRTCKCDHDHVLVNVTHCGPEQSCLAGSRPCLDQLSCQPPEKFCNGHVDCYDHSDENCKSRQGKQMEAMLLLMANICSLRYCGEAVVRRHRSRSSYLQHLSAGHLHLCTL